MSDEKGSGGTGAAGQQEPPKGSVWPLIAMILLTLWMCGRHNPEADLKQCGEHLHQIGVALEHYRLASDDKLYPKTLEGAFKGKSIPDCKANGSGSYASGYQPSSDRRSYLLVCKGDKHQAAGVPSDYPRIAFGPDEASLPHALPSPQPQATPSVEATPPAAQAKAGKVQDGSPPHSPTPRPESKQKK